MFLILNYLIYLGFSTFSYQDSTLTIADESSIAESQIQSEYKKATKCIITSNGEVSIQSNVFRAFTSLKQLYIEVSTINFEDSSFKQMTGVSEIKVNASNSINIAENAFAASGIDYIELNAQKQITLNQQSFITSFTINVLNITSEGTVTIGELAFENSQIKSIFIVSTNTVNLGIKSFKECAYITTFQVESKDSGVLFDSSTFESAEIEELIIKSHDDVSLNRESIEGQFEKLSIETKGNFATYKHTFSHSNMKEFYIKCNGYANFAAQTFQQTAEFTNFTILSNQYIAFEQHSFLQSKINSMTFITNGSISFGKQCFQKTTNLDTFTVNASGELFFGDHAFLGSSINSIYINASGSIVFSKQSFQNCLQLTNFNIETPSDVTFGQQCFHNSQVQEVIITWPEETTSNSVKLSSSASTVTFEKQSFGQCEQLSQVNIHTGGNVNIQSNSFKNSKSLSNVVIDIKGKATIADFAFSGCKSLSEADISAGSQEVSEKAYQQGGDDDDDGGKKKKKGGSSGKDDDDDSQENAKILGNIEIETVYLGTSPNIYLNLNFLLGLMKNVRKLFGRIVPSPELIHSAIWVGRKDADDDTLGAIFVYGKYWNKKNLPSYIDRDGAKACLMSLKEFKQRYPAIDPMKLNPNRKMKLFDFIEEVQNSGKWRASDYNWPTNNCQHFTSKLINILKATRNDPNNNDWIDLPKPVLNSLKYNENQKN